MYENCSFVPLSSYNSLPKTTCVYCISGQYVSENLLQTAYIGSSNDLRNRAGAHYRDLENGSHVNPFLQNVYKKYPGTWFIGILEETTKENQFCKEQHYLDLLQPFCDYNRGFNINKSASKPPSAKGRKLSPEHKLKFYLANKGKKRSPEIAKKIWKSRKNNGTTGRGKKQSLEHIQKIQESKRKNGTTRQCFKARQKMSLAHKGKKLSAETKAKMSVSRKGKKMSLECIQKRIETRKKNKLLKQINQSVQN